MGTWYSTQMNAAHQPDTGERGDLGELGDEDPRQPISSPSALALLRMTPKRSLEQQKPEQHQRHRDVLPAEVLLHRADEALVVNPARPLSQAAR